MDAPRPTLPAEGVPDLPGGDGRWLLLLLLLTVGLRGWQVGTTEVASRDSVTYIRQAWRLENEAWAEVIRTSPQHPGYGVLVYLAARPIRAVVEDLPRAMQLAAQLASCLASVLLVVPMYYLGRALFDRRVAVAGTLLLQVLPSTGRMFPDGLSEALFLALTAAALVGAVRGLRGGGWGWFALAGLATGLAYLTRTEGMLVGLTTGLVLLGLQATTRWRRPWRELLGHGGALAGSCALVALPFMLLIGGVSLKASYRYMLDPEGWKLPARNEVLAAPLPPALWNYGPEVQPQHRYGWAVWATLQVINDSLFHVLTPLVVLGLWLSRRRFAEAPGLWVLLLTGLILLPLLYKLGQSNGYLGERHAVLLVLGGVFFAALALNTIAAWLTRLRPGLSGGWLASLLLLGVVAVCLPKTLGRLHANRSGFREAGEWLARHSAPGDPVIDPLTWTSYHAGRVFTEGRTDLVRSQPAVRYVVLEHSKNRHPHLYYLLDPATALARHGEVCHRILARRGRSSAEVVIYRVTEERLARQP